MDRWLSLSVLIGWLLAAPAFGQSPGATVDDVVEVLPPLRVRVAQAQGPEASPGKKTEAPTPPVQLAMPVLVADPEGDRLAVVPWAKVEYLLWWPKGMSLPPLVTTSPPGTPREAVGVLGQPGTQVLFGDSREGDDALSGGRFTLGCWCNEQRTFGLEASFFFLEYARFGFQDASDGGRSLARPFFNVNPNFFIQGSELVADPGSAFGGVIVDGTSTFLGAEGLLRCLLCGNDDPCSNRSWRVDMVGGYRYLHLRERLGIQEDLASTDPANPFVVKGTRFQVSDQFRTTNDFHGGQVGLSSEITRGRWSLSGLAKVALGVNVQTADIAGNTVVTVPGQAPALQPGGLLALPTNIGHYRRDAFAVVPEFGASLSYQVTQHVRLSVGYTFLLWCDVARPGDQIDLAVNSSQIGGAPLVGAARPQFAFRDTSFWAQGLSLSARWDF